jgi:Pin2-interacting protein X1
LSLFSGVLGRLNGKSEGELQKQQDALRDAEVRLYHEHKYGLIKFVPGGWLVGDKIQPNKADADPISEQNRLLAKSKPTKKRKAAEVEPFEEDITSSSTLAKKLKKSKKTRRGEEDSDAKQENIDGDRILASSDSNANEIPYSDMDAALEVPDTSELRSSSTRKNKRKDKDKDRNRIKREKTREDEQIAVSSMSSDSDKAARKREKRARKEERRKRKEGKAKRKSEVGVKDDGRQTMSLPVSISETPTSGASTPVAGYGHRQAIRQRYIQQKRMASMDPQAMKEIFMLKAAG